MNSHTVRLVQCGLVAAAAAVATMGVALADGSGPSGAAPTEAGAAPTEATADPTATPATHMPPIPSDAPIEVSRTSGTGPSEVLQFDPKTDLYTVAATCTSPGGAQSLGLNDPTGEFDPIEVWCDGVPTSMTIDSVGALQKLRVAAADDISWTLVIYGGTPESVHVVDGE